MISIPNYNVVIPVAEDLYLTCNSTEQTSPRLANIATITVSGTTMTIPFTPTCSDWVELYSNGRRIINPRVKQRLGGTQYEIFNVSGNQITFNQPQQATYTVICDTKPLHDTTSLIIDINNVQGFLSTTASLYVEPIVMEQPANGYARLTTNRKSIAYMPSYGFIGNDSFSYCVINNHGQYSRNYCVNITVLG